MKFVRILFLLLLLSTLLFSTVSGEPTGAAITSNTTETISPVAAASSTTAGGSFTTLVLNATTQSPRWKAYVGNVTGSFTLQDAANFTLYDWSGGTPTGEVYASRNSSVDWSTIACANGTSIAAEESVLNHTASQVDSLNNTFNESVHQTFYVGTVQLTNSTCPAIATYVNSTDQGLGENADFQEILLQDAGGNLIFSALINQDTAGYDNALYDFQMIVPEDEYTSTPHTYYFYMELS